MLIVSNYPTRNILLRILYFNLKYTNKLQFTQNHKNIFNTIKYLNKCYVYYLIVAGASIFIEPKKGYGLCTNNSSHLYSQTQIQTY